MNDIEIFYNKYIAYDFDDILLNTNNNLVNSYEFYIKFKEDYLFRTNENFENYKIYITKLEELNNKIYFKESEKRIYVTIIDENEKNNVKKYINNIQTTQRRLYDNFLHYVNFLNENKYNYISNSRPKSLRSIRSVKSISSINSNSSDNTKEFKIKNVINRLLDKSNRKSKRN